MAVPAGISSSIGPAPPDTGAASGTPTSPPSGTISAKSKDAGDSKSKNCTLNCTLEELAVLRLLKANSKATQEQLAEQIHRSPRTVKTLTSRLTEKGYLTRRNGKRDGWWEVLIEIPEAQGG